MNGEARRRTQFGLASEHLSRLLLLVVCFSDATPSQDPETKADLRNFQTLGFVDDTSHRSKVLQLFFFSSENEMQMPQMKTHNKKSVLMAVTGKFYVKLLAFEDKRSLGLESISGLGSFLAAKSSGNNGLDRLRGGAYILTEGQSLFVPYGHLDCPADVSPSSEPPGDGFVAVPPCHSANTNAVEKMRRTR